jgi:transmembrane sensor
VQVTVSDYRTEVGEQRVVTLADGSKVHLNTQSHLQSRFTSEGREVDLLAGEAMFIVAKDRLRPFRVHTDSALVQATGTQFNVDRHDERLVIAVFEGSVRVALPGPPGYTELTRFAPLQAGELLEVQRNIKGAELHITMPAPDRLARRVRWTSGVLTFADEPLADVVAEMNRYNRRQIVIEDAAIAGLAIGGRFKPTDLPTFVESLRSMANVEVEWPPDAKPIRLRKPKSTTL